MQLDIAKTIQENLYALLNTRNISGTPFTSANVTVGAPTAWVDPDGQSTHNTLIVVTGVRGFWAGTAEERYTRLDLANFGTGAVEYQTADEDTLALIKTGIATQLGLLESEFELDITELPDFSVEDTVEINIDAVAGSYAYIGTRAVTLQRPQDPPLSSAFSSQDLDGFEQPA